MRAVAIAVESANSEACVDSLREPYLQALSSVQWLHRRLLEVIKDEFDRRGRSEIAAGSGAAPLQHRRSGAIRWRTPYARLLSRHECLYNLKKLVDLGLVEHQRSRVDLRSVRIKLTANGLEVYEIVNALCQKLRKRWSRRAGSMRTNLQSSRNCSLAWSASGLIR